MNVVKDLATIISIIGSTITLAGLYYSDEEVDKRKIRFFKKIARIVIVTIVLWTICICFLVLDFQTDLLTVLSLVNPTLLFFHFLICYKF